MMRVRVSLAIGVLGVAVLAGAAATRTQIRAFGQIQPGAWQLRALDKSGFAERLCIADAHDLIQLRHPAAPCSRFVLTNEPQTTTVHYTCTGAGYGRTTIKVESGQLIRIESQGLVNQSPFQMSLEGRWVGGCAQEKASR
jgi:hypothetical protein